MSKFAAFNPPLRTLMGPGPSDVPQRILDAMARPTIGHLDPEFIALMDDIKSLLQYAFMTDNRLTLPVSAPGSAGMEACFVNLVQPNDTVIVCINGVFGMRMRENIERCGATAVVVEDEWGAPVDPQKVEEAFRKNPKASILAFVHAETSTGAQSDAKQLCKIAKDNCALTIVDTVTSLGGTKVKVDKWGIDAVYSGTQKCLSASPGISPVSFSEAALKRIELRSETVQSWFLDMNLVMGYWRGENKSGGKRSYHHTAPINALYGLHEALLILHEEGLKNAWARHAKNHLALRDALESMGLEFVVEEKYRLPQLNAVSIPDKIDDAKLRNYLLSKHSLEIGAGLGALAGKVWRIGLMGNSSSQKNVLFCIEALADALQQQGYKVDAKQALSIAAAYY